jgi:hypothetical protein
LQRLDDLARRARLWILDEQILKCEAAGNGCHVLSECASLF